MLTYKQYFKLIKEWVNSNGLHFDEGIVIEECTGTQVTNTMIGRLAAKLVYENAQIDASQRSD